jgi:ATP phosphoribosyltransferase regulatory subunit
MNIDLSLLDPMEKLTYALRTLYMGAGYARYRLGKFEEYDFYSRNKDFLISDNVITFVDTNGRLMALKPDVTLAIVKNLRDDPDRLQKLCYDENVYRVSRATGSFMEIMQTGLECIGRVDMACVGEVLSLAAASLKVCSGDYLLEVSDLDILGAFLDAITDDRALRTALLKPVSEKNTHSLAGLCRENGVEDGVWEPLCRLLEVSGPYGEVFPRVQALCGPLGLERELRDLRAALAVFDGTPDGDRVILDFSAVSNMNYYNGVIFQGFISSLPGSVLSGGQYDNLMRRLHRSSGAVGFAVYLDQIQRLENLGEEEDPC